MSHPKANNLTDRLKQQNCNGQKQNRKTRLRTKFFVLFLSLLLSLFVLEIIIRCFSIPSFLVKPQFFYAKNDILGWELAKNFKGVVKTQEFTTDITINSKGFRDYEYAGNKKDDAYRIVALGDSFTFGFGVSFKNIYLKILEKNMNSHFSGQQNIEIINTGVPGYCFLQEFLFLKEKGVKYDPDLVLIGFDINDHIDSIEPFDTTYKGFLIKRDSLKSPLLKERIFIYKNFQSIYLISKTFSIIKNKLIKTKEMKTLLDEQLKKKYKEKSLSFTSQILKEMKEFCQKRNIKILLVFIPHKSQVHPNILKPPLYSYYFDNLDSFLGDACQNNKIAYLNMLPDFKRSAEQGKQLYFNIDGHWNSDGHRLAAELIHKKLIELEFVDKIRPMTKAEE